MSEIKLAKEIEDKGRDKYLIPAEHVREYVSRAVTELGVDNNFVNDTDSTMYAWRLSHQKENETVAREVLGMQFASLSELARAMADADETIVSRIQNDPRYSLPSPIFQLSNLSGC